MLKKFAVLPLLFLSFLAFAEDSKCSFIIADIRVEGLQRISAGSVFASLPFNINDEANASNVREAIRVLFRSGSFDDVSIGRDGDVLVVTLQERPSISSIKIEGNKAIKTEDLLSGLAQSGLAEGQVFKRATLEGIRLELQRQYVSQGRYDASIVAEVEALPRNRVALHIDVDEGSVAKIKHINIVGNEHFSRKKLLRMFEMRKTGWISWATGDDKYARERLRADLETLESFYRDQGYLKFAVDSTQVSLSPERDAVFITVNITEGDIYEVSEVKLSGDIILPEAVLRQLILLRAGDTYSQQKVTVSEEFISRVLGNEGYAFSKVRSYPEVNEEDQTVQLTFFVDPGKRTYVNRIEFYGNTTTKDEVLRREMRQMEAAPASGQKIEQSRVRLERLGFFSSVSSELEPVPGSDDLVNVVYTVEEQQSGSIGASVGFSDASGIVLSANLQQNNFLGSGKQVGFGVTRNDFQTRYNFSYTNPYYTVDGVSRGFTVFLRETDFDELGVAEFSSNSWGGTLNYGYPISETARLGFGVGYTNIEIETGPFAPREVRSSPTPLFNVNNFVSANVVDGNTTTNTAAGLGNVDDLLNAGIDPFIQTEPGFLDNNGDNFDSFTVTANIRESKLNRGLLPTKGHSQSFSVELGIPGTDLEYFKLIYDGQIFVPVANDVSFRFHGQFGYGDGYGDTEDLPFFENFFSGGFGSVRGYERSSLGPRGTPAQSYLVTQLDGQAAYVYDEIARQFVLQNLVNSQDPIGGNVLVEAGVEFIFPLWFIEDRRSLRTVLFIDSGNVYDTNCGPEQELCFDIDLTELRASYGFGLTWISALGPLTFSLARPVNNSREDDTKFFQFSIGTGF